ncbi:MAG: winged helix-turn-helix domain-containing protein [Rubrivivax sp.]|nr:winged helix-turn-helix domain-containing protein [Rubrivivax sp.]
MNARSVSLPPVQFGRFELRPAQRVLLDGGVPVPLGGRAFDVLVVLAAQAGRLVPKSQLLDEAWPGLVVEEGNVAAQIMALRKALGSDAIATVAGHGYRFTLAAEPVGAAEGAPHAAASSSPAAPAMPAAARHNLPAAATSFVGRTAEIAQITGLLQTHRLVSLLGPGGIGKTRLALQVATGQLDARHGFVDGVWWIELAPLFDAALVAADAAALWGLRAGDGSSIEQVLLRHLAPRRLLLVLDNCEHLREGTAALVRRILRQAPGVTLLATSRESLGVPGEVEFRVGSLALPAEGSADASGDAVRLFLERMQAVRPGAALAADELAEVLRACRRLQGMPLALELAAARLRSLTPHELADRLDDSFRVLGTTAKDALPHQRSLDAALDWSHDLLAPEERVLLRRLAVFAGGFELEAAEAVCPVDALPDAMTNDAAAHVAVPVESVVDRLDALVDKSLVLPLAGSAPRARFHLLEPTRQYALQRLRAAGEEHAVAAAHARHVAAFVAAIAPGLRGPAQVAARQRIERELGNVRVALRTLLAQGEHERYLRLAFDLFSFWGHAALHVEGLQVLLEGLRAAGDDTPAAVRARAWFAAAELAAQLSDPRSVEHARAGLAVATAAGLPAEAARLRLELAASLHRTGDDFEAFRRELDAAELALAQHPGAPWWEPEWDAAYLHLLLVSSEWSAHPQYEAHQQAALQGFERAGDVAMAALALAYSAMLAGRLDTATIVGNLERTMAMLESSPSPHIEGHGELILGRVLAARGDVEPAGRYLASAMRKLIDLGDVNCWSGACRSLAAIQLDRGDVGSACEHLEAVLRALPQVLSTTAAAAQALDLAAAALLAQGRLDEAAFALGVDVGRIDDGARSGRPRSARAPGPRPRHDPVRQALAQRLGAEAVQRRVDEAAALPADAALQRVIGWLRG